MFWTWAAVWAANHAWLAFWLAFWTIVCMTTIIHKVLGILDWLILTRRRR